MFLGLPVAVWGAFGYGVAAVLAARALARARRGGAASTGLLFAVAAVAVAASVGLAIVSKAAIGAWCLLCVASWVTAVALLAAAWRACPAVPAAAVAADLAAMRAQPARSAGLALVLLAVVVGTRAAYPRYWSARPARPATVAPPAGARTPAPAPASATLAADRVVVEFSDYECPFCARAHEQLALLRAARPDLEIVRRHFPLDAACNPAVKRSIHPSACGLARAAICADAQGRFPQMDDALFKNQQAGEPVSRLAAGIGLDVPAFEACPHVPRDGGTARARRRGRHARRRARHPLVRRRRQGLRGRAPASDLERALGVRADSSRRGALTLFVCGAMAAPIHGATIDRDTPSTEGVRPSWTGLSRTVRVHCRAP